MHFTQYSKHKHLLGIVFGALVISGLTSFVWAYTVSSPEVVETNRYAVLYNNNTAEIVFRDRSHNEARIYKAAIEPLYINEEKSRQGWGAVGYTLPEVTLRDENEKRVVFTIQNGTQNGEWCDTNIFYVDYEAQTAHSAKTLGCIFKSLDQKDHTRFWTQEYVSYSETEEPYFNIGVGDYIDGHLIASTSVQIPVWTDGVSSIGWYGINPSNVVSNKEMTKVVFAFTAGPECGDSRQECDTPAYIYLFDLQSGKVRDVTPEKEVTYKTLYPRDNMDISSLQYVQDDTTDSSSGQFIIVGNGGYDDPYAVIDVGGL